MKFKIPMSPMDIDTVLIDSQHLPNLPADALTDSLEFQRVSDGKYTCVLPVRIPCSVNKTTSQIKDSISVVSKITLTVMAEKTKKGAMRLVYKAEMPYAALDLDALNLAEPKYAHGVNRSKDTISVHFVQYLPKAFVDDAQGLKSGGATCLAAFSQLACVQFLAKLLTGEGSTFGADSVFGCNAMPAICSNDFPGDGIFGTRGNADDILGARYTPAKVVNNVPGFDGATGLELGTPNLSQTETAAPIVRAIMGLKPMLDDGAYGASHPELRNLDIQPE